MKDHCWVQCPSTGGRRQQCQSFTVPEKPRFLLTQVSLRWAPSPWAEPPLARHVLYLRQSSVSHSHRLLLRTLISSGLFQYWCEFFVGFLDDEVILSWWVVKYTFCLTPIYGFSLSEKKKTNSLFLEIYKTWMGMKKLLNAATLVSYFLLKVL